MDAWRQMKVAIDPFTAAANLVVSARTAIVNRVVFGGTPMKLAAALSFLLYFSAGLAQAQDADGIPFLLTYLSVYLLSK